MQRHTQDCLLSLSVAISLAMQGYIPVVRTIKTKIERRQKETKNIDDNKYCINKKEEKDTDSQSVDLVLCSQG